MKLWSTILGLSLFAVAAVGCGVTADGGDSAVDGPLGSVEQDQIDPLRVYSISQLGQVVISAYAMTVNGVTEEYWAVKPTYQATALREFNGASQTCAGWKRSVCDGTWSTATFYRAVISPTTLNCALPPGPCTPPSGSTTILGNGSYDVYDSVGVPFAWTYVSGGCEYWSMNHLISSGVSDQSAHSPAWSSLSNFETAMCAKSPVPSNWYSVSYVPITNFCSTFTC